MMSTPGPWALRGRQIRAENGIGKHVADYMVDAEDGRLIAEAPTLYLLLKAVVDAREQSKTGAAFLTRSERFLEMARQAFERIEKKEPWEN